MTYELRRKLDQVARRHRQLLLLRVLALCWLFWTLAAAGLFWISSIATVDLTAHWPALAALAAVSAVALVLTTYRVRRGDLWVARRIEQRHPDLGALLLAAVEQPSGRGRIGYLQMAVIDDAVRHSRHHDWTQTVSTGQMRMAQLAQFGALCLLLAVLAALVFTSGAVGGQGLLSAGRGSAAAGDVWVEVTPGDTELERGSTLLVIADFPGAVPAEATLIVQDRADGSEDSVRASDDGSGSERDTAVASRAMSRNLSDPQFIGRAPSVRGDIDYHVEFEGGRSPTYRVTVFDYPELIRADAQLKYPGYTHMEPALVEDVRHITAVEGTRVTLICRLNKDVADARLIDSRDRETLLVRDAGSVPVYRVELLLTESRRYELRLTDDRGRRNKLPAEIVVNVVPNRPAEIRLTRPAQDLRVSPLEEISLAASLSDDYGLLDYGVSYSLGGEATRDVSLSDSAGDPPAKQQDAQYVLDVEALRAEPDRLISYYVWAEDTGPDEQPRRVYSDMYFAEVRHFEEIFRQGEQPPGGADQQSAQQQGQQGGGNAEAATQLAELQKQLVAATWKLIRRETSSQATAEFEGDARLLVESQQEALNQAEQLAERLEDDESRDHLDDAREQMTKALAELSTAADGPATASLPAALAAEQAAYQALLKLRAREFEVIRQNSRQQGQQSGSASGSGNRSQQQLSELELSTDENRYETQSRATAPDQNADQAQREMRDFLNRLRELARRQEDLNDRLQELQSALQAAQTEEEREELERQLKRLREQQQDMLRDTDELAGQMEQSDNRQQLEQSREQMEESRRRVQQASEALDEGRLSQALNEGARAERELNELGDEIRRQTSEQFDRQMRELRDAARQLDERQQQISEQIDRLNAEENRSLRDSGERQQAQQQIGEQRDELDQLSERMRETIQDAEQPEPLLARQLYDTLRETESARIDDALDVTDRLLEAGVTREAGEVVEDADRGISQLRDGIDRAAENVLGDETEALRRAGEQLQDLANELNREIDEQLANRQPGDNPLEDQQGQNQQGQNQQGQNQQGQNQQGQNQQGQNQQGQNQQGQRSDQPGGARQQGSDDGNRQASFQEFLEAGGGGPGGPITGDNFRDWADRMRNVEEMLDDRQLSTEAARIRNRAEDARAEFRREYQEPDWQEMRNLVAEPLNELIDRIAEEVLRRQSPDALVPIDRDPVPAEFVDDVRQYYERLGSGR